jgi:hypothetical protein
MANPKLSVAVIMQRRPTRNRWQSELWEPLGVLAGYPAGAPQLLRDDGAAQQWLYPGFEVTLRRDECEGYWLNVSSPEPRVFVRWSVEEGHAVPEMLTLSYDEASRWMDGGAQVDAVAMAPELFAWLGQYVEDHYRPEPKKRVRPQSFKHPKDRARS